MMEKNLQDEIRILHDEVKKRVIMMLKGQELRSDLFDEYGRERLLRKGTQLTEDVLNDMPYETMVRLKIATDDEDLDPDDDAFDPGRTDQAGVADVAGLLAEDRAQQLFLRRQLRLAFG